jgi:fatty acid synthase
LEEVYREAGIDPAQVNYVETHGTGTKVGDPQEANAICDVFCRDRTTPLLIGSVKSNMGHAEPASGLCSVAKVLIAMESGFIPPNLHYKEPNPYIPGLTDGRLHVVTEKMPWNGGYVGVNSFGFGGSNTHICLRSHPKTAKLDPHAALGIKVPKVNNDITITLLIIILCRFYVMAVVHKKQLKQC